MNDEHQPGREGERPTMPDVEPIPEPTVAGHVPYWAAGGPPTAPIEPPVAASVPSSTGTAPTPPLLPPPPPASTDRRGSSSTAVDAAPEAPRADGRGATPRWVVPFAVLAALALFAGGTLAGWALASRDDAGTTAPTVEAGGGGLTPVVDPADPPVAGDSEEPVAAVAEAVAPSVVQIETNNGLGSGVIFDDEGHILTAAHVLDGAIQLRVRLADGTLVPAEIVGTNAATDVGVVAIEPRDDLVPAALGVDADIQVGQLAVAVGSPFGLDQTITSGVVSALDRPVQTEGSSIVGMIQTDASINPGNSGGALADRFGRIIGINDAIRTSSGGNEGVGFAIPIDLAVRVAEQLIAGEEIQAGLLGVTVSDPTDGAPGALISEIMEGTPAAESELRVGDLITAIDGEAISGTQNLRAEILARSPGATVTVEILREDEQIELEITLTSATD